MLQRDGLKQFFVGGVLFEQLQQGVQCLFRGLPGQRTVELGQARVIVSWVEEVILAGAAGWDVLTGGASTAP